MKKLLAVLKLSNLILISAVILVSSSCAMFNKTQSLDLRSEARTTDELISDKELERSIEAVLKKTSEKFDSANVKVLASKGWILLVGEVPEIEMIDQASSITQNIGGVVEVHNHLKVDKNRTLLESAHDNWLKLKVRNHLGIDPEFPSQKITVYAQKGIVYLMGQVSQEHVQQAVIEAKEVGGSQEVVTIFEVIE